MDCHLRPAIAVVSLLVVCGPCGSLAQNALPSSAPTPAAKGRPAHVARTLSKNDRSSVIAVALHTKTTRRPGRDCSHLVHAIYQRAGFPYDYADSEDLYDGVTGFRRVLHPQPADLVVWRGHVGIVIHPSGHEFFSMLRTGPGVDDYLSRYWRGRGQPRFYRYVKNNS